MMDWLIFLIVTAAALTAFALIPVIVIGAIELYRARDL
jgi:hypothetical protein